MLENRNNIGIGHLHEGAEEVNFMKYIRAIIINETDSCVVLAPREAHCSSVGHNVAKSVEIYLANSTEPGTTMVKKLQ